jgi:dolichol-phosphate mannosyltransferase
MLRLGVITPLANEEAGIDEWMRRVLAQLGETDGVFCVLDNVSRDRTREKVAEWAQRDRRVTLVWAPENRCVVDAYFRGYRAAFDAGAEWILEMDGGLSHLPEEIPAFIAAMQNGAEFAAGSRFIQGGGYSGQWSRYLVSRGGTALTNLMLGTRMADMTSGFECFSRRAMAEVLTRGVRSKAHFFQTEIRFMLHSWRWVEVPIHYTNPSKRLGSASVKEAFRILGQLRRESKQKKFGAAK